MKTYIYSLMALCFLFASCQKDPVSPANDTKMIKVGEAGLQGNKKLELFSSDTLTTGYHSIFIKITNADGTGNSSAAVSLATMMDMGSMKHASPVVQPVYSGSKSLYEAAVVFTMPSSESAHWYLEVTVDGEMKSIPVNVPASKTKLSASYAGSDGSSYIVSLIPSAPFTPGLNDFKILVNKKVSMMSFPPVNDLQILFTPEMPAMGHSSPNNVNPVSIGNGVYKGAVNFTMTGAWRLHFKLMSGSQVLVEDAYLDVEF